MSHVVFLTRGHWDWITPFLEELATRHFEYPRYNPNTKQMQSFFLKSRLCPIQLWDMSFPKKHTDAVLTTLFKGTTGKGMASNEYLNKYFWPLRKVMKLQKIPKYNTDKQLVMSPINHIEIMGIGYKDDKWVTEDGKIVDEKDRTPLSSEEI